MVKNIASVRRQGLSRGGEFNAVAPETLVPGDVVRLSAADMIPGDLRLLEAKDLFINQSVLTGEAMLAEKFQTPYADAGVALSISPTCASWGRAWSVAMPPA